IWPLRRVLHLVDHNLGRFPDLGRHYSLQARAARMARRQFGATTRVARRAWGNDSLVANMSARLAEGAKSLAHTKARPAEMGSVDSGGGDALAALQLVVLLERFGGASIDEDAVSAEAAAGPLSAALEQECSVFLDRHRAYAGLVGSPPVPE